MANPKNNSTQAAESSNEIDLARTFGTLIDHCWLIVGVTCIFTVLGIVYSLFATPIYQSDALVQVEQNVGNSLLNNLSEILPNNQPPSAAEIQLIQSRMVIGKTIDDLKLDVVVKQKFMPIFGKGLNRLLGRSEYDVVVSKFDVPKINYDKEYTLEIVDAKTYILSLDGEEILTGKIGQLEQKAGVEILITDTNAAPGTNFSVVRRPVLAVINDLLEKLQVADKGKDTGVLALSLEGSNPQEIQAILDSISKNYLLQNVERKSAEAEKSLVFLKEQLPEVQAKLDSSENELNQFRQQNESVDLSLEAKSALDTMVALDSQLNELTFREAELSKLYTKEHPAYRALLEKKQTLEKDKVNLNKHIASLPKTQQQILRLTRDAKVSQEVYMQLLNKQQELNISKASTVGNVRIVDTAVTQPKPVRPKKALIVALATVLGGVLSVVYVLVMAALRKGLESPDELEELGISVYASIPLSEWQQKQDRKFKLRKANSSSHAKSTDLLAIGNPADLAIESIRSLRTSLHFASLEAKNNILMISGASPSIGKTFVSVNLAAVIAQAGPRVILIDCDMRRGYTHLQMQTPVDNGLSDVLSEQVSLDKCIKKTKVENLDFITRGTIPPNPTELLMHTNFEKLLKWCSDNYDLVLVDTPPILAVTDAAIIGRHVGTSLMVARFDVNTTKEVMLSIRRFEQNGVDIKGVIINAVVKKAASHYTYGYYNYEYTSDKK
ncbi:TPA: tyrosine-protein kinase Wzc [Serratia fonticola]